MTSSAAKSWSDKLNDLGWTKVEITGNTEPYVSVWTKTNPERRRNPVPGLVNYSIMVFAEDACRAVTIKADVNEWARAALPIGHRYYKTGFYDIGFLAPKANTPGASGKEKWTISATMSEIEECPNGE